MKILIVDDEPRVRRGLTSFDWEKYGISVMASCWSGSSALALIEREGVPDIILTDVRMPQGDGFFLAERVRQIEKDKTTRCSIIFLSGYSDIEYIQKAFSVEAVQYLLKPIDQDEFARMIERVVSIRTKGVTTQRNQLDQEVDVLTYRADVFSHSKATEALKILQQEYHNPSLSLSNVAERLGVNPNYLSTLFRQQNGDTFSEMLEQIRIERSLILLSDLSLPIGSISFLVGYRDQRYFSVRFKEHVGLTPSAYRRSHFES